jgi:hypothetical protein
MHTTGGHTTKMIRPSAPPHGHFDQNGCSEMFGNPNTGTVANGRAIRNASQWIN